jgi:hypothetical protein
MIKIETGDVPCCVYVSDVEDHFNIKQQFLDFLKNTPVFGSKFKQMESLYNSDFYIKSEFKDETYFDLVRPIFKQHNENLSNLLGYKFENLNIFNIWYQQYAKNDFHDWHRHKSSVFNNIYYVDLPAGASKTTFRFLGKEFQVEVKEGQILSFPSFYEHCSKPNLSDNIKTVIAFNSN